MSDKKTSKPAGVNEGIQATTVNAEVLAVGRNARASKTYGPGEKEEIARAIQQLHEALDALQLQPHAKAAIDENLEELHSAVLSEEPKADDVVRALQAIGGKLKMVGVVLTDALALSAPIAQIAHMLQIPLHLLGL